MVTTVTFAIQNPVTLLVSHHATLLHRTRRVNRANLDVAGCGSCCSLSPSSLGPEEGGRAMEAGRNEAKKEASREPAKQASPAGSPPNFCVTEPNKCPTPSPFLGGGVKTEKRKSMYGKHLVIPQGKHGITT